MSLRELVRIGSIGPQTLMSANQQDWTPVRESQSLTFDPPTPLQVPIAPRQEIPARANAWNFIATCVVAVVVIFVIGWASTPHETQPFHSSVVGSAPNKDLQVADRTFQYWKQVSGIFREAAAASGGTSAFRSCAAAVESLPTAGVDPDAVNCALGFTALLKECADLVQSENDPSATADQMLSAFYGGWSGDFQPLVRDLESRNEAHRALAAHVKNAEQQLIQTRAILSSRYGVEFPSL